MKKIFGILSLAVLILLLVSCGSSSKEKELGKVYYDEDNNIKYYQANVVDVTERQYFALNENLFVDKDSHLAFDDYGNLCPEECDLIAIDYQWVEDHCMLEDGHQCIEEGYYNYRITNLEEDENNYYVVFYVVCYYYETTPDNIRRIETGGWGYYKQWDWTKSAILYPMTFSKERYRIDIEQEED